MVRNLGHFRPALQAGVVAMLVLVSPAANVKAQLGSPSTKPSTAPQPRRGADPPPTDFSQYQHVDLLSISRLILKLTKELSALIHANQGHGHGGDGFNALDVLQKVSELRHAVRARRAMQMAQVLEEAVDEMIQEEAAAARAGREPTQQAVEQAADKADLKIENKRQQLETTPAVEPGSRPSNNPPPPDEQPTIEEIKQNPKASAARVLNRLLQVIDDPDSLLNSRHRTDPSRAVADVKESVEKIILVGENVSPVYAAELRKALDPVVERMEKREQEGTAWLEAGARLIQTTPTTPAERAETEARQTWRQQNERLKADLDGADKSLRRAEKNLNEQQGTVNRVDYQDALKVHARATEALRSHLSKQPD